MKLRALERRLRSADRYVCVWSILQKMLMILVETFQPFVFSRTQSLDQFIFNFSSSTKKLSLRFSSFLKRMIGCMAVEIPLFISSTFVYFNLFFTGTDFFPFHFPALPPTFRKPPHSGARSRPTEAETPLPAT